MKTLPILQRLFDQVEILCPQTKSYVAGRLDPTAVSKGRSQSVEINGRYYFIEWMSHWGLEVEIYCAEGEFERPKVIAHNYMEHGGGLYPRIWKKGDFILLATILKEISKQQKFTQCQINQERQKKSVKI